MKNLEKRTDFLFPKRNFWTGFSSILNVFGEPNKFKTAKTGADLDSWALRSDWEMVGQDIRKAMFDLKL